MHLYDFVAMNFKPQNGSLVGLRQFLDPCTNKEDKNTPLGALHELESVTMWNSSLMERKMEIEW